MWLGNGQHNDVCMYVCLIEWRFFLIEKLDKSKILHKHTLHFPSINLIDGTLGCHRGPVRIEVALQEVYSGQCDMGTQR